MTDVRFNKTRHLFRLSLVACVLVSGSLLAQEASEPPVSDLDLLDQAIEEMLHKQEPEVGTDEELVELLKIEIRDLKQTLAQIKEILDDKWVELAALHEEYNALRQENEVLQQHIRLRYGGDGGGLPSVPMPNRELIESILGDSELEGADAVRDTLEQSEKQAPVAKPSASGELEYQIVDEWGRSPEVAQRLGKDTSSLKGMALVVDATAPEDRLAALGRTLRDRYLAYDNLNIGLFNDHLSAQAFAQTGVLDENHLLMRIMRHKASGRDSLLAYREGLAVELPR